MKLLSDKLLSFFFPHKCTFCQKAIHYKNNTYICHNCLTSLPFIKGTKCLKCSTPRHDMSMPVCYNCRKYKHSFTSSFTPLIYKDKVRKSILDMKFHNKESFCRSFAYLIANEILKEGYPDFDFITFVPLSKESFFSRGFNQSETIAQECGKILNCPVVETLIRIDGTPRQSTLPMRERQKNAKKAFKGKDLKLEGTALLIDDVYTTGSTMSHNSSLLLKMGCDKVYIACVALNQKK